MTDNLTDAREAVGKAAVDLVVAVERMRKAEPQQVWITDENGNLMQGGESNGISAYHHAMRLARAFIVQIATPRYPDTDTLARGGVPEDRMPPAQDKIPEGFVPIWGGAAAVRILALDRDRLGSDVRPLDLAALLVHPGPGPAPGWRTGPTPIG
jgi:hypothetical protein